ncbi:MAG: lytic transglycosylase domain-containing protein [Kiritimatiellae bacterium]|nr:lytic transglycosylase domain-containing protein [Kiritimatiellia bacterium]
MTRRIRNISVMGITLSIGLLMAGAAGTAFYFHIHAYDKIIAEAGREYDVDTILIRAVIWRESHFNRGHVGKNREIGLMQVTPNAARDWATAVHEPIPLRQDLFKPEINIRAGTWYLHKAIQYWSAKPKSNPLPYALAEYNAGRSNSLRWAARDKNDPNVFWNEITYPSTRRYVKDILCRYRCAK